MSEEHVPPAREDIPAPKAPQSFARRFNLAGIAALLLATGLIGGLQYFGIVDLRNISSSGLAVSATDSEAVLVRVNGTEITNGQVEKRLEQLKSVYTAQGVDLEASGQLEQFRASVLDEMINNALLLDAAQKEGISVTDAELDSEYTNLLNMFGGEEALNEQLTLVGMTKEDLRTNLREQKIITAYIANHSDLGSAEVSDEEAKTYYDQNVATAADPASVPPFEEVKEMLKEQIAQERTSSLIAVLIENLKKDAQIEKL